MAVAGVLELQLVADVARIRSDMDRMQGIVTRGSKAMQQALDEVRGRVAGLFSGASVVGFGMWIKGAIDFQDQLNDLNKTTGISVQRLAGLSLMSKQSGSDLTGVAQSINKLSMEMGKDAEKFARIGITAKDPLEAFKQLSEIFRAIEDPQMRAAVAAEALGKGWAGAAPALAEGAQRIDEMVRRGEELAGITERDTQLADEFNDSLSELQIALTGAASNLAGDMLPLLIELVKSLTEVTHEANQVDGSFNVVTETLRALIITGGNVAFVIHTIAAEIGVMAAQTAAFFSGDFKLAAQIGKEWTAEAAKRRQDFDAWEGRMLGAGRATRQVVADQKAGLTDVSSAALRAFVDGDKAGKAAQKAREEFDKLVGRITGKDAGVDADFMTNLKMLAAEGTKAGMPMADIIKLQETYIHQQPYMVKAAKERADLADEIGKQEAAIAQKDVEYITDKIEAQQRATKSAEDQLKAIQFETLALTMTNVERQKAIALRELEATGLDKNSEAYARMATEISNAVDKRESTRASVEFSEGLHDDLRGALTRAFEDSKNPAKAFAEAFGSAIYTRVSSKLADALTDGLLGGKSGGGLGNFGGLLGSLFGGAGSMAAGSSSFGVGAAYMDGPFMHTGGIVGAESSYSRAVSASVFSGAPRFHTGGIVGDEVPIIAKRGEGVLTPAQMRAMGSSGGQPINITNVFTVGDVASETMLKKEVQQSERRMIAGLARAQRYGRPA